MGRYLVLWLLGIPIPILVPDLALWWPSLTAPPACETGVTVRPVSATLCYDNSATFSTTISA